MYSGSRQLVVVPTGCSGAANSRVISFLGFLRPLTSVQHNKMAENDTQHTVESIGTTPSQSEDVWEDFPWTKFSGYTKAQRPRQVQWRKATVCE